jgi:aminoglycoside phosphotransferase (APT) family kinase protein
MKSEMCLERLRATILNVFPGLINAEFKLLTAGWDCVAVDVEDRLIFRFPRETGVEKSLVTEVSLLAVIHPAVTMPVPDVTIYQGPPLFSGHRKIPGEHLLSPQYELLPIEARQRLAADMALFYSQLHSLEDAKMEAAGARSVSAWLQPEEILRRVWPVLPRELLAYAERTIADWQQLAPDPYGTTYGFFDGHGWNMAFDHTNHRLNGLYDFGDSGFGDLHREFTYSNWISSDLTARIVNEYELITGRALDRERIQLLSGALRLSELAEAADDPDHIDAMVQTVADWSARNSELT